MNTEGWNRARELFDGALERTPAERAAFLDEHCADAPELRAEVERLLAADDVEDDFMRADGGALIALPGEVTGPVVGGRVGPFVLTRAIAAGGMGMVFEAEQERPRRKVALKTLRGGFWSPDQVRRFRTEVEVLGMLQHPGIAQIHEAGTHEEHGIALPYFAMELVLGARTILEHASDERLDLRARLRLFLEVCEAVHYGHTKGVIHRDLKPGNVLVDQRGRVKVIDFGLARVVDPSAASISMSFAETQTGHVLGTLPYMSPEHLSGTSFQVDVRSDVYSLGCVLHELLTGRTPIDPSGLALPAALLRIERGDPDISTELPRDLRWILVRALERSPKRRYASVTALGADLERFLRHEPVSVGAPSTTYRLLRFARRNRTGLVFVGAIIAALSIGLVRANRAYARESTALGKESAALVKERAARIELTTALAKESAALAGERTAREKAESERQMMEKVSFVLEFFVVALDPLHAGREARVVDVIERQVVPRIQYTQDPRVETYLKTWIGQAYVNLRELDKAHEYLELAWAQAQERFDPESTYRIHTAGVYADLLERMGRVRESAELSEQILPVAEEVFGVFHNRANYLRYNLAICLRRLGESGRAEGLLRQLLTFYERAEGAEGTAIMARKDIGGAIAEQGRLADAAEWYETTVAFAQQHEGAGSQACATVRMELASVRLRQGRAAESEEQLAQVEEVFVGQGASPRNLRALRTAQVWTHLALEKFEAAEADLTELESLIAASGGAPGEDDVVVAGGRAELARRRGEEGALARASEAFELATELLPPHHPHRVRAAEIRARVHFDREEWALADAFLMEVEGTLADMVATGDTRMQELLKLRVEALRGAGRGAEADAVRLRLNE